MATIVRVKELPTINAAETELLNQFSEVFRVEVTSGGASPIEALRKCEILPLDPASVRAYQQKKESVRRFLVGSTLAWQRVWQISAALLAALVAHMIYFSIIAEPMFQAKSEAKPWDFIHIIGMIVTVIFLIVGLAARYGNDEVTTVSKSWARMPLQQWVQMQRLVPAFALSKAVALKKEIPRATFFY